MNDQADASSERDVRWAGAESKEAHQMLSERRAKQAAAFLLPHLHSGMRVLDCGCGPGNITLGLAEAVCPGEVVGVDLEEKYIQEALGRAAQEGITNVRFVTGSVYALDFADHSFDGVLAHCVLEHLAKPVEALVEMRRVLRPGGVLGIRDADWDGVLLAPIRPIMLESIRAYIAIGESGGGSQRIGKHLRRMLNEAGFERIEVEAQHHTYATPEAVRQRGQRMASVFREVAARDEVISLGLADRETLLAMAEAWDEWAEDPDAFMAGSDCRALAWA